jgi:hypothetical protein
MRGDGVETETDREAFLCRSSFVIHQRCVSGACCVYMQIGCISSSQVGEASRQDMATLLRLACVPACLRACLRAWCCVPACLRVKADRLTGCRRAGVALLHSVIVTVTIYRCHWLLSTTALPTHLASRACFCLCLFVACCLWALGALGLAAHACYFALLLSLLFYNTAFKTPPSAPPYYGVK